MRTVLIDLPLKCRGYIYEDVATGEKCCILNARLNRESNVKTYKHELTHDSAGDLDKPINVDKNEAERHLV